MGAVPSRHPRNRAVSADRTPERPHGIGSLLRLVALVMVATGAPVLVALGMHWRLA
jgi:hypothetical protein